MASFVRDRKQADVHILITTQGTGGGGREYTIEFIGQKDFAGMKDLLKFQSKESDTQDDIRNGLARTVNMGLVRYVALTPQADHISVGYDAPVEQEEVKDKWNHWVFEVGAYPWMSGCKSSRSSSIGGDLSARRVTEWLRLQFSLYGHRREDRYEYDGDVTLDVSSWKGADALAYWSLGNHWSAGASIAVRASTYSNDKANVSLFPALEYSLYPYSESTRRQFRFTYYIGARYVDYIEETLYDKHNEWLGKELLKVSLEMIEPWGEAFISLTGSHYFHDISKYRLELYSRLSMRLYEGLSFNLRGGASRINDQVSLRKGELSKEDVLLRRTELATSYDYSISFGVSYAFGSTDNSTVNPRFGY
jgi:hypothetical protein